MSSVLAAMSGGVDSAVAALLLAKQGYTCAGGTMKLFSQDETGAFRCDLPFTEEEFSDAARTARSIGIPFRVYDFREQFMREVLSRFTRAYEIGQTPNPCVYCNRYLKFGALFDAALSQGFDYVATGHYARVEKSGGRYYLKKAADQKKDQSYFLYHLTQRELAHVLFPLGEMTKEQVRKTAHAAGLEIAKKKDSQDICFVPDGDYVKVLEQYTGHAFPHGCFVSTDGTVLGEHKGIVRYTVGQRKGLGLSLSEPLYVSDKCPQKNEIVLCRDQELFSRSLDAEDFNWIAPQIPRGSIRVCAKIRFNQTEQPAQAEAVGDGRVHVVFDQPQRAIARGQSVVLYDGDIVLGGGTIL